jgi:hypothetical protein
LDALKKQLFLLVFGKVQKPFKTEHHSPKKVYTVTVKPILNSKQGPNDYLDIILREWLVVAADGGASFVVSAAAVVVSEVVAVGVAFASTGVDTFCPRPR